MSLLSMNDDAEISKYVEIRRLKRDTIRAQKLKDLKTNLVQPDLQVYLDHVQLEDEIDITLININKASRC